MFGGGGGPPTVAVVNEHGTLASVETPKTANADLGSFPEASEETERERSPSPPPSSPGVTLVRKFGSLLVGRGDDSRRSGTHGKRTSILGGFTPRASTEVNGEEEKRQISAGPMMQSEKQSTAERTSVSSPSSPVPSPAPALSHSQSQHLPAAHRRAATLLDAQGRAAKHERRSSTGGNLLSGAIGGSVGRHRRPSTGFGTSSRPVGDKIFGRTDEEDEAALEKENVNGNGKENGYVKDEGHPQDDKDFKPVFLKGLFRSVIRPAVWLSLAEYFL